MGRPGKPYEVLVREGKSHRTKAELEARKNGEAAFATGEEMKVRPEVKENVVAYKEFKRITKLLIKISKNDAIYEAVINRYCLLYAECLDFEKKQERFYMDLYELEEDKERLVDSEEMSLSAYYRLKNQIQKNILGLDKQVQSKRKMLCDIEKENIMTIASAIRNIPKQEEEKANPLLEVLRGG
ncbi:hypothetical protein [Anaerotignum sp. MB30-C6]|uniref:hypothetical protein n=1 Tax=Anaerotignum sp. MB30-C6 TaxID=3070814 RepID=UPI0027DBF21C|nr:hypothetical protein [Anaerotignum sp. MB30-C6]WMI81586.1 hypothetical protein RBQ60_02285 [Anaerotignum sp. MB30-C6]